tara:strand:+ start:526 stop:783 length:258 start_codon:yes stop_codon:yes gene_type:complete
MNIEEENNAKEYYISSDINGIHTPRTNMVEINYLDMLKLMHGYAEKQVKKFNISGVGSTLCEHEPVDLNINPILSKCGTCGEMKH